MSNSSKNPDRFNMRLDPELKQMVKHAANLKGVPASGYVKSVLAREAAKDIEEQEFLNLSFKDREAFAKAILEPIEPSADSIKAAREYKKQFGL